VLVDPLGGAEVEPPSDVDELHHAQGDGLDSSQGGSLWPPGRRRDPLCTGNISALVPQHLVGVVCLATLETLVLLAVQSGSGLAEGGGDHAVAGPIDLLCAGLAVGVAEVLIMGLVDLYLLKPKTYVPEAHVYYCTWPCPLACPCTPPSCPTSR